MDNTISTALSEVASTMSASINPGAVAGIIALVLGSGVALYLTWFGIRKVISVVRNALKGKLSV